MITAPDENLFYFVAAPALILAIIFAIFAIFALLRLKMVFQASKSSRVSLIFYLFISLESLLRTSLCLYIAIKSYLMTSSKPELNDNPLSHKIFLSFQYLPDLFFWLLFTLLLWQLLVLFYMTHINNNALDPLVTNKKTTSEGKLFNVFIVIWITYLIIQLIFFSLFQADIIELSFYAEQNSLFNLLLPVILFIIEVYLHIVFSGTPYISLLASNNTGIINKVLFVWAIGRILHAVWTVYLAFYEPNVYKKVMQEEELEDSTYYEMIMLVFFEISDKIFNEFLAFLFVFDLEFVKIFYNFRQEKGVDSFISINVLNYEKAEQNPMDSKLSLINSKNLIIKGPLEADNIEISKDLEKFTKKNGFGSLELCYIKPDFSKVYFSRKLKLQGFTNYLAEEFMNDLVKYYELQCLEDFRLEKLINYSIFETNNEKFLNIIYEFYQNSSLGNLLKTQKNLAFEIKAKTAIGVAKIFHKFHTNEPPLIHGHLSSYNILFDEEFNPIISNFGLFSLKKYYTILHSYIYKTIYTAPEALKSNIFKREMSMDVYSFGIILYELFVEKIVNEINSVRKLVQLVCEEKARPKIPEDLDKRMANLIRCCWQDEEWKRPGFGQIRESLKKILLVD